MPNIEDIEDRLSANNKEGVTIPEASVSEQQASASTPPLAEANDGVSAEKAPAARVLDFNNIDETSQRFTNALTNSRQREFGLDR